MMSKQEFYEEIKENIREYLPPEYEDAEISLTTQVKNMDVEMTGLLIRLPGESAAPVIYLDSMYIPAAARPWLLFRLILTP